MKIGYQDFMPGVLRSGLFSDTHETLASAVARANEWIRQSDFRLINVETVVLPNVREVEEASQVGLHTSGEMGTYWFQIVRVWYEIKTSLD